MWASFRYFHPHGVDPGCSLTTQVCVNLSRDAADDLHAFGVHHTTFTVHWSSHRHFFLCFYGGCYCPNIRYFHPHGVAPGYPPIAQVCVNLSRDVVDDLRAFGVHHDTSTDQWNSQHHNFCVWRGQKTVTRLPTWSRLWVPPDHPSLCQPSQGCC